MNKPLLSPYERKRISWRESALALLALGCAAGWLHERVDNRNSEEVKEFVDGLRQLRHNPDAVVDVVVFDKGSFPISCRMQRMAAPTTPAKAAIDEPPGAEESKPEDDSNPVQDAKEPAKPSPEAASTSEPAEAGR